MILKPKIFISIAPILLLSVSCSLFGQTTPAGVVKTVNGGADWQFVNKFKDAQQGSMAGLNISSLGVDRRQKERIFAGSYNEGLYRSEDAGNTWEQILSRIAVYDFIFDPQDSNRIYVGGFFADHGKLVMTKDGGKSWEEIFNDPSTQNAVRAVVINPQNPSEILIGLTAGALVKSLDGGGTWKLVGEHHDRINKLWWQNDGVYALFQNRGIFKSRDGGENFVDISTGLRTAQNFFQNAINSADGNVFYQMVISPFNPGLFYVTTRNGLFKTLDGGVNWQRMPLPIVEDTVAVRAVAISASNDNVVYASAGATIYKTLDGGVQWRTQGVPTGGFINSLLVDPELPQTAYAGIYVQQ